MSETFPTLPPNLGTRVREAVSEALRFWEPRRLLYNAVLAAIVLTHFALNLPHSRMLLSFEALLAGFVLMVLANICYCAAYVVDVFVQVSGFRDTWLKWRWVLLAIGIAFAGIITRWISMGFFGSRPPTIL